MKLISPHMLSTMRRGAERLYTKHRDALPDAKVSMKLDIAKELGLSTSDAKPTPITVSGGEVIGLFDDEKKESTVIPTLMVVVKLTAYIEALQTYDASETKALAVVKQAADKEGK